jgi:chromosome segregation ATPase
LHEELIIAGGQLREGRFSRMNVTETQAAYAAAEAQGAPGFIEDKLKELWPKIEAPLRQALEARMTDRTKNLQTFLDDRAEREVTNFTAVMGELERSIRETLAEKDDAQLQFDWTAEEKDQRQRDLGDLRARLAKIPAELKLETQHLRDRYRDPQPRLFPVAVTFLIPPRAVAQLSP